jgi:hypothetical protein
MKFTPFLILSLFLPFSLSAQSVVVSDGSYAKSGIQEEISLHPSMLITPVLMQNMEMQYQQGGLLQPVRDNAGIAFASSAIIPGLGQAANRNWIRAGVFMAVEVTSIWLAVEYTNRGRRGERSYERWADQNWSVVQYANWLVQYHDVHGIFNPYIDQLRDMLNGASAAFDTSIDWRIVDLALLRNVERNTPYFVTDDLFASNFSHVLPDYGSQQYYELIAKYFQFQAGWRDYDDFHNSLGHVNGMFNERFFIDRNGAYASPLFWDGVARAQQFNDDYRTGRNFRMLLIANHVFSAFDAYFTVRLKQNRLEATPSVMPGHQLSVSYRF